MYQPEGPLGKGRSHSPASGLQWQGWDFSGYFDGIACKQELFREGWGRGGVLLSLSQRVGAEQDGMPAPHEVVLREQWSERMGGVWV